MQCTVVLQKEKKIKESLKISKWHFCVLAAMASRLSGIDSSISKQKNPQKYRTFLVPWSFELAQYLILRVGALLSRPGNAKKKIKHKF